jgi:CDGSH-type Zn-finger protein
MAEVRIRTRDNGPFVVEGPIRLVDAEGNEFTIMSEKPAIALCRCGGSKNRPFCDGSHRSNGFQSADRAKST